MLINEKIEVYSGKIVLVPYEETHVLKYHDWMQSEELLTATASEPLTLEEEYEMQKSWRRDDDKLTFIVLDKERRNEGEVAAMIGDTNLFIINNDIAEVMIMIAEPSYRRLGYGQEALTLILRYGVEALDIKKFEAKITADNTASISLFKKFGFEIISESSIFNEVTLGRHVTEEWLRSLSSAAPYKIIPRT